MSDGGDRTGRDGPVDDGGDAGLTRPAEERAGDQLRQVSGSREGPGGMKKPAGPNLRGVVDGVAEELRAGGVEENVRREAERLVCHALGLDRHELALGDDAPRLGAEEAGRLARALRRRLDGEPLQHIEGTVQFRELTLLCDRRALIPRPETEQLVERVAQWIRGEVGEGGPRDVERALDIGTGSGAIALSLLYEGLAREALGLDVSREALQLAGQNRDRVGGIDDERLELRLASSPLWNSVSSSERFDLVVSNPPYVSDGEMEDLPEEVRDYEPETALAGGPDGMDVIREILGRGARYLRPGGALFLEIGEDQGEAVRRLASGTGEWSRVEVGRDLAGRDRFVRLHAD
ncbi:MAG: peptide chain release factor N(5)-glutamine methyltransferase [Candidatus Palauibacterales bacterium]|nr:peptide chain release factor N(5)-glutamine methyltransferase [Candidatus Palauibacterales bacterium]